LFSEALHSSDILLPDGSGIVLAAKVLRGATIPKIAGSDIHTHLLKALNQIGGKVFYLGASAETLEKIKERLQREYPRIKMGMYSPPYKNEFAAEDNRLMIEAVNAFVPDILFVGMTAPKQEKWVHQHKQTLNAPLICSIGAVFDFFAGTRKRSGKVWIKLGLEWLPRLIREPRRMWKRNFVSTPCFLIDMLIAKATKRNNQ
jgi:N-acetylglucosaminyldiphosphoundecaprenol N-acetyl-beta-D-mannosaminyltransferase